MNYYKIFSILAILFGFTGNLLEFEIILFRGYALPISYFNIIFTLLLSILGGYLLAISNEK